MINWILIFAISAGQLIKFPSNGSSGTTMLDLSIIALSLFGILKFKNFKKLPHLFLSTLLFIFICIISLVLTPLHLKQTEFLQSFVYTIRFSLYFFAGYLIYCGIIKINIEKIILSSSIIISILGLAQLIFLPDLKVMSLLGWDPHFFRTTSTFLDPNFLGAFLILPLLMLSIKNDFKKTNRTLLFILIFATLLTTFSRSSYLMFLFSGTALSFLKKSIRLFIITIILFGILLSGFQVYTILVSRPRNIDRGSSAKARLNTWQQGVRIFEHAPILGVGYNAYRYSLLEYNLAESDFTNTRGASSNDASSLNILATTGILGLLSYLYFLFVFLKQGLESHEKSSGFISFAFITGLLIHSFFNNSLFYPQILILIILLTATLSIHKK